MARLPFAEGPDSRMRIVACKNAGDDLNHQKRPCPHPGPRCATCWRAELKRRKLKAKEQRVEKVYGITGAEYDALLAAQGGVCFICRIAKGTGRKRLAVDHDHKHCDICVGPQSCGDPDSIRGLLCSTDNQLLGIRGHGALSRAVTYLLDPPAPEILRRLRGND